MAESSLRPPVTALAPPLPGGAVAPSASAFSRIAATVRWVESRPRNELPNGRRRSLPAQAGGAWGFLTAGATVSGASGMTLGHGTVTLCSRAGYTLTADGDSVEVLNAGGGVTAGAGGRILKLGWVDGVWSLDVFPCS